MRCVRNVGKQWLCLGLMCTALGIWSRACLLVNELMRLYVRPGLSIRVLTALQTRLREAMASGSDAQNAVASPSREGEHGDRARSRSRARGEEGNEDVTNMNQPLGAEPHVPEDRREEGKGEGEDAPEVQDVTKKGASRLELMTEVMACTKALSAASEDLSLVMKELKWTKKEMADGYKLLAEQMDATNKAIVTMGASITHQSSEISRMLRAFDKHAGTVRALFGFMTQSECFQKHSLYSWVGMLWLHRFRKFFDLSEVPEFNWEVYGSSISILDMAIHLRCWWGLFYYHLRVFEIPWHCEDNAYVSYLRYSGIVKTMPTYLIWDTPVLYGQCLRIFLGLWVLDLEVHFVTCTSVAYSWRLVIAVSELL